MKRNFKNEQGFSVIELLLLLIFLAIVVFTGVYVAHNHNSKKTTQSTSSSSGTNTINKTADAAGSTAATIATNLLNAGNQQGTPGLVAYVDSHVSDGEFTSSFKTAVDNRTALPNGGASPVACTNGIFPDSFAAGATSLSGDTAITTPKLISKGSDVTSQYDQIPQITLSYINNAWSIDNYTCINNPSPANSQSTAGFP